MQVEEKRAFQRRQATWQDYMAAKKAVSTAYEAVQSALKDRLAARDKLNYEFAALQKEKEPGSEVWAAFRQSRDYYGHYIDSLRQKADEEHQAMCECFERASRAYECGDKTIASGLSAEGHEHETRRNKLNAKIGQLCSKIKELRRDAERRAPKPDYSAFDAAKAKFDQAKAVHQEAQGIFKSLDSQKKRAKEKFEKAKAAHRQAEAALRSGLRKPRAINH